MKRFMLFVISFFFLCSTSFASSKRIDAKLDKCVDGDTAKFVINEKLETVRFLAIDTPEYTTKKETYGKEASAFTCDRLTHANKIEIEIEPNSDTYDRYDRLLAWIWVDDYLLQEDLIKEGLAEVAYLYGDYKYTPLLEVQEGIAKVKKINIWENEQLINFGDMTISKLILFSVIVVVLIYLKKYKLEIKRK